MQMKAAIFDMDGTLIDSLMVWDVLWKTFGERFRDGREFKPEVHLDKAVRTLPLKEAMELVHTTCRIGGSGEELLRAANEIIEHFYRFDVNMKAGVKEFLEHCYEKGVKMCIASATDPYLIDIAVKHCGIEKYFSKIFSCAEIGKGKEYPDVYLMALEHLGTSAEETWIFEDSYVALNTARKIGMPAVGIYDRYNYGQEILRENATVYVGEGENLMKLV